MKWEDIPDDIKKRLIDIKKLDYLRNSMNQDVVDGFIIAVIIFFTIKLLWWFMNLEDVGTLKFLIGFLLGRVSA